MDDFTTNQIDPLAYVPNVPLGATAYNQSASLAIQAALQSPRGISAWMFLDDDDED